MRNVKILFSLKRVFFLLLFIIIGYFKHGKTYIFVKAGTLSYVLQAFS